MERSTALIMALVAVSLLIIPAQLAFASAGPLMLSGSTWGSQSSPMAVEPGSTYVPYTVYLSNAGQYPVENASIELYPTYPLNFSPGAASEVNFTLIPPGATVPAVFYMNVAPGASDGIYNISSFVNYTVVVGNSTIHSTEVYNFTQRLQVPVTLYARPIAYLAYWGSQSSPTAAYPGMQHGVLTVVVGNSGTGPAYNASILISVKYPIRLVTDNVSVGTIPPGAQIPVSFIAGVSLNATTGDYPVNVTIHYNDGLTASAVVYAPVSLAPSISVQGYGIAQGNVFPGDNDVVLQVYLVNVGNTTAQDASAVVSLPAPLEPAYPGSTQEVVGMLPPGQPVPLSFRFDVPSSASSPEDLYVPLNVSYEGGSVSFLIPIHISSLANFSSEPYSMSALSQGASNVKISYMITNDGNASAKLVSAQLVLPSGLSGNTFTYVGDLSPGQSSLATFSLDVSSGTPVGDYAAILELTWIQSNAPGRQFTQEIPVEFHVSEGYVQLLESWFTSASGIEMLVLVVVVIAAVVLAVSLARARRSR
ncbi:MAG: COG1361 S-layer family protein [Conexivisphaerales archaeon]|nr:COG1361 S-layer family protein [Conexivisphaerales archaeon]